MGNHRLNISLSLPPASEQGELYRLTSLLSAEVGLGRGVNESCHEVGAQGGEEKTSVLAEAGARWASTVLGLEAGPKRVFS